MRKATIKFLILSLRPSVCPYATTRLPLNGFSWNLILSVFRKSVQKVQVSLKSDKNNGHFTWRPIYTYFWSYLAHFFLEWEMFQTKVVEKIKTHTLCSFFSKIVPVMRKYGKLKYSQTGHRWQHGTSALRDGYVSLKTHTQNMQYLLLCHCNNGCTNVPQCYVIRILPVLLSLNIPSYFVLMFIIFLG